MPEGLLTPEGKPLDVAAAVEQDFARAMSATATDVPAPPKKPVDAATEPAKAKRGRPPKADQARVTNAVPGASTADLDKSRLEGVKGFAQIGAGVCLMLDARTPESDISWRADAVTLANTAEPLAIACIQVAKNNASFASALDKVTQVGPYGALISVGLSIAGQLARNHGVKAGEMLGAVAPETLLASLEEETADGAPSKPR